LRAGVSGRGFLEEEGESAVVFAVSLLLLVALLLSVRVVEVLKFCASASAADLGAPVVMEVDDIGSSFVEEVALSLLSTSRSESDESEACRLMASDLTERAGSRVSDRGCGDGGCGR
jgi:hypothetical protein